MPLDCVIVTCAVTRGLIALARTPHLPVTPEQVAGACPGAAGAGAAVAHSHVREPGTGKPSMGPGLHQDVIERIRRRDTDLIFNVTTSLGGPVVTNAPGSVRRMARVIREAGVKLEIELFDPGDIALMHDLVADGSTGPSPLCSFVTGVRCGFQPSPETVPYAHGPLPPDPPLTAVGIGKTAFTMAAQPFLASGHGRVGLEDWMYLGKGVLAPSNAAMATKVRGIVEALGGQVADPAEARAA